MLVILVVNWRNELPWQCHAVAARGWDWRLAPLPVCTTTCRAVALFLNPYENKPSQSKESFSFFTSLHFFFLFFHYLQSHSLSRCLSLFLCPSDSSLHWFFFSTLLAATTFLALFLVQPKVYSPFLRSPRKSWPFYLSVRTIWSPLALHTPASECGGKQHTPLTLSSSMYFLLLSSEKARKRLVCATKRKEVKGDFFLPYSWVAFQLSGDKQLGLAADNGKASRTANSRGQCNSLTACN